MQAEKTSRGVGIPDRGTLASQIGQENRIVRPINILLDEKSIGEVWRSEADCLKDFLQAGFSIDRIEKKIKTKLVYHGQALTLFEVEGRNAYLEFTGRYQKDADQEIRALIA